MMLTHFQTTPLLSTYLIAGIVTNFSHNSTASLNTNLWYRNSSALNMQFASHVIKYTTLYLKRKWYRGHEIRGTKVNHIAIPNFSDKNMMNLGLVIYGEDDIIYDEKFKPVGHKIEISHLIGYKISQEWFYQFSDAIWNSTTFWFNDCLIRFLGTYAVDKAVPNLHIMDLFVVQSHHEVLDFDNSYYTYFLFNKSYEFPRCIKVSIILRMLLNTLSENTFWNYVRTYIIKTYLDYNNLNTFNENKKKINYMGVSNINKSELLDMIQIIGPWTKQKHYPTISVKRDYDFPGKMVVLIENYIKNSSTKYYIPLTHTVQKELDFNNTTPHYWAEQKETYLMNKILTNHDWVIFNIQQIGYYRVNYDLKNWKKIAHYLATINYTKIHVLNRAQIIDDAFHFMITRQLESATFWKITEYLKHELDFVAWYPMLKALEYMSSVFPLSDEETDKIKQRMQNILSKVYDELPHNKIKKDDSAKRLKQESAKWLCFFDDQKCKKVANHNLIRSLREPEKFKLLPWWKEWTYCNGLKISSYPDIINDKNSTWWKVYHMGKENFKILEYLACFEHPDFITDYLNMIGNDNETSSLKDLRVQDRINCFLSTIAKHARKDKVLNFIINKFMEIKPKEINESVMFTVLLNHLYSEEQLEKVKEFAITNLTKLQAALTKRLEENLDKPVEKILEIIRSIQQQQEKDYMIQVYKQIQIKINLRSHQIETQMRYLNTLII
ncbi:aminopeptidase N-like isoform X2 [Cataglyphis hispanica]|nr:aminopeptidase N-like isoform X2 [Cataglyphis hispanica]